MYNVIKEAVVTEKAKLLEIQGWYAFTVDARANKTQIAEAFETIYGSKASEVRILKVRAKTKIGAKRTPNRRRAAAVKAYVKLDKPVAQLAKVK